MKLHKGAFDGKDLYFVRTDASDRAFATAEKLVFVPKLATLTGVGLSGAVYLFDNGAAGQAPVFSNEPGGDGYTPAWTVHKVTWRGTPRRMSSVAEIEAAKSRGDVDVDKSNVVVNYSLVKWSSGSLPVDTEKKAYLGTGQLLEEPDTTGGRVTFKLSECYPGNRYFVVDHSMAPMAEGTFTGFAPGLPGRAQQGRRHRAHQRVHERHQRHRSHGVPAVGVRLRRRGPRVESVLGPLRLQMEGKRNAQAAHQPVRAVPGARRRRRRGVPRRA
jgi:hypothetical protein